MSLQFPNQHGRGSRLRRRGSIFVLLAVVVIVLTVGGLASAGVRGGTKASGPAKGGTLTLLGQSDIFNLDTTSGYYTVDNILERSFTRQLVSYPNAPAFLAQIQLKPDIATAVPTKANGGISADGKTYTLHIKPGVKWNTSPPRAGHRGRLRPRVQDALQSRLPDRSAGLLHEHDHRDEGLLHGLRQGEGHRGRRSRRTSNGHACPVWSRRTARRWSSTSPAPPPTSRTSWRWGSLRLARSST